MSIPLQQRSIPWFSVVLFGFSAFSALTLFAISATMLISAAMDWTNNQRMDVLIPSAAIAASTAFGAIMLLPSAYYSLQKIISDKPVSKVMLKWPNRIHWLIFILAWPLTIWLGNWSTAYSGIALLVLPTANIFAIVIPVVIIVMLGAGYLPINSYQRGWGTFSLGMILSPMIIVIFEILAAGMFATGVFLIASRNPLIINEIINIVNRVSIAPTEDAILRIVGPYLAKPEVIYLSLAYFSLIVPVIEEALKPIAVWLLADRINTPAEGFALGVISGAGYAIFESLGISSSVTTDGWAGLALARSGTSLLHIVNSGLMGFALVSAWKEGRYLKLGLVYLLTVLVHGLWNGFSLSMGIGLLSEINKIIPEYFHSIGITGLAILVLVFIILLVKGNRSLRNAL